MNGLKYVWLSSWHDVPVCGCSTVHSSFLHHFYHCPSPSFALLVIWPQTEHPVAMPGCLADECPLICWLSFSPLLNCLCSCALGSPVLHYNNCNKLCTLRLLGLFSSMFPLITTHKKHQLQRESCFFSMQAKFLAVYETRISAVTLSLVLKRWFMLSLFTWCLLLYFRPVTEKKTPLLRNHSICSSPQRFPSVLITLLCDASFSKTNKV